MDAHKGNLAWAPSFLRPQSVEPPIHSLDFVVVDIPEEDMPPPAMDAHESKPSSQLALTQSGRSSIDSLDFVVVDIPQEEKTHMVLPAMDQLARTPSSQLTLTESIGSSIKSLTDIPEEEEKSQLHPLSALPLYFSHHLFFLLPNLITKSTDLLAWRSGPVQWFIGDDNERVIKKTIPAKGDVQMWDAVELYINGDRYEGQLYKEKGTCSGSGVYKSRVMSYEGDWIDGKYDGFGVETWARGKRYRGQYRQGLRHGFGAYCFDNGNSYAGEWVGGQSQGTGVQTCSEGSYYIGEFRRGVKHGFGCYYFKNGDNYFGDYFDDKLCGFGVYHFANGHRYEGSWYQGRRQGFGTYTFGNGETISGEWDDGVLKTPLLPSHPAVERAVLAARKAANNATLVPRVRVEEQVNKAVSASFRAATAARVASIKAVQLDTKRNGMLSRMLNLLNSCT